jgi:serine phosphatase RsbU (regulator of sigma subunit)
MFIVHENSIQKIKGDPYSVGSLFSKKNVVFVQQEILLQKNAGIFFSTDGFQDQSGGISGKRFLTKELENLFLRVSALGIKEQEETIIKAFEDWKGKQPQRDDVLLVGIKT